jgi:NodT family efflux transporter outer membrane factor (OMF) lipoprotein
MGIERVNRRLARIGVVACMAAAALAGCKAVGPDFHAPQPDAPPSWDAGEAGRFAAAGASAPASVVSAQPAQAGRWWTVFGDPVLDDLVGDALAQNLDLQGAAVRIEAARAQEQSARGAAWPSVAGSVLAGRTRFSEHGLLSSLGGGGSSGGSSQGSAPDGNGSPGGQGSDQSSGPSLVSGLYQVGFDATWELDLWGRVRRSIEAAGADRASAEEAARDARVSLVAEVVRTYVGLRSTERQIAIAQDNLAAQRRLDELVRSRHRAGFTPESDVAAQSAQVQGALAQLPPLLQEQAQARNRLALLLALPPGALHDRLDTGPATIALALPPEVPVGLPGDLLRRRPDIRRRAADLHAATARIGVAEARLFPSVTLGLFGGLQATRTADLADWGSRFFLGGAQLTLPIFQGGQLRAQVAVADAQARQAVLAYRSTVLAAFHDADDAWVAYAQEQQRTAALQGQWQEARRARELSEDRWRSGLTSYMEVLIADHNALMAQRELAQSSALAQTDLVALFKALGGGWE